MMNITEQHLIKQVFAAAYRHRHTIDEVFALTTCEYLELDQANQREFSRVTVAAIAPLQSTRLWLRFVTEVPAYYHGQTVVLQADLVGSALVYLNGCPVHGMDPCHNEIILSDAAQSGQQWSLMLEIARKIDFARLLTIPASDATTTPKKPLTYLTLAIRDSETWRLGHQLREALMLVDAMLTPISDNYRAAIAEIANAFLADKSVVAAEQASQRIHELVRIPGNDYQQPPARIFCFGHAHIDLAWLWPTRESRYKCGCSFATALHLLEHYPQFVFTQSSVPFYLWTQKYFPQLWTQIKQKVAQGRWEVSTGMWVESDTNLTSGESLVRQILWGKTFARENFAVEVDSLWLPDTFGFSANLPQLLQKAGIRYFATIKIAWNDTNVFPYHTFWWQAPDGSRVLAHIPPSGNYTSFLNLTNLLQSVDNYCQRLPATTQPLLLFPYGYGDGGGGPTSEMLENAEFYQQQLANIGVEQCQLSDALAAIAAKADDLPCWHGELYLEKHRGTYTTQAAIKQANRHAEVLFHDAEALATLAYIYGAPYPDDLLSQGWSHILTNQFHDILPGSSIAAVYEQARDEYHQSTKIGERVCAEATDFLMQQIAISGPGRALVVWNTLGWRRSSPVVDFQEQPCRIFDSNGTVIPGQWIEQQGRKAMLFCAEDIPALGYKVYYLTNSEPESPPAAFPAAVDHIENRFFRVQLDAKGHLASIYDKRYHREILAGPGNQYQMFADCPLQWDAWDIAADFAQSRQNIDSLHQIELVEAGPVRTVLRLQRPLGEKSSLSQDIILWEKLPRIDFIGEVDWYESRKMLKVGFPLAIVSDQVKAEIAFGHVARPTHSNTSWEKARYEFAAHKWVDFSQADYGVALFNDCKYGHDMVANHLRLTLLRSPKSPDPNADLGHHRFRYALWPHGGDLTHSDVIPAAYQFNFPLRGCHSDAHPGKWPQQMSFVEVNGAGVILETLKKAHRSDQIVWRLYESYGGNTHAVITTAFPMQESGISDLLECPLSVLPLPQSHRVELHLAPFSVETLLVTVNHIGGKRPMTL